MWAIASNEGDPGVSRWIENYVAVSQSIDEIGCSVSIVGIPWNADAYSIPEWSRALTANLAWLWDEVETVLGECGISCREKQNCYAFGCMHA